MKPGVQLGDSGYNRVEGKEGTQPSGEILPQHLLSRVTRNLNKYPGLILKQLLHYLMIYFQNSTLNNVTFGRKGKCTQDDKLAH